MKNKLVKLHHLISENLKTATVLQRDIYHQQVGLLNTAFSNRIIVILHILWPSLVLVKEQHSELSDIKKKLFPLESTLVLQITALLYVLTPSPSDRTFWIG